MGHPSEENSEILQNANSQINMPYSYKDIPCRVLKCADQKLWIKIDSYYCYHQFWHRHILILQRSL